MEGRRLNSNTPKRDGAPLDRPDSKMAYTGEVTESDLEDHAFTMRREIGLTDAKIVVTATKEQLHRAGQEPNRGW